MLKRKGNTGYIIIIIVVIIIIIIITTTTTINTTFKENGRFRFVSNIALHRMTRMKSFTLFVPLVTKSPVAKIRRDMKRERERESYTKGVWYYYDSVLTCTLQVLVKFKTIFEVFS